MIVWSLGICRYAGGFTMFYGPCNNHRHGKYGKCPFKSEYHPRDVRIDQDKGFCWLFSGKKALRFVLLSCWPWVCRCCVPKRQVLDVCVENAWSSDSYTRHGCRWCSFDFKGSWKLWLMFIETTYPSWKLHSCRWCFNVWTDASDGSSWIMVQLLSQLSPQVRPLRSYAPKVHGLRHLLRHVKFEAAGVFFSFLDAISQNLAP